MPMLDALLNNRVRLIDYEKMVDDSVSMRGMRSIYRAVTEKDKGVKGKKRRRRWRVNKQIKSKERKKERRRERERERD